MKTHNDKYLDKYLATNLNTYHKANEHNWDTVIIVVGKEGSGKSTFASQIAYHLDPTFNVSRCVFTPDEFTKAMDKAKPMQAIQYDEADQFSTDYRQSAETKKLISGLKRVRKKRLFLILCTPDFFGLHKYVTLSRANCMIRVYAHGGYKRGRFLFYGPKSMRKLYIRGKREHNWNAARSNFFSTFSNWSSLDEEAYDVKKDESIKDYFIDKPKERDQKEVEKSDIKFLRFLNDSKYIKHGKMVEIAKNYFNITSDALSHRLRALKLKNDGQ